MIISFGRNALRIIMGMDNNHLIGAGLIILFICGIWLTGLLLRHPKTFSECFGIGLISATITFCLKDYEVGIIPAVLLGLLIFKLGKVLNVFFNSIFTIKN